MVNRKISHGFWFYREKYAKHNPAGTRIGLVGSVEIWHAEIAASAARRCTQRQAVGPTTRKGGIMRFTLTSHIGHKTVTLSLVVKSNNRHPGW